MNGKNLIEILKKNQIYNSVENNSFSFKTRRPQNFYKSRKLKILIFRWGNNLKIKSII